MSDARKRSLERSVSSVEDYAAVLRHRMRTGELDPQRVALAAFLGYSPALEAVEPAVLFVPMSATSWSRVRQALSFAVLDKPSQPILTQVLNFGDLDKPTLVTLTADFADRLPTGPEGQAAIAAARAWVACPCEKHRRAAKRAEKAAEQVAASASEAAGAAGAPGAEPWWAARTAARMAREVGRAAADACDDAEGFAPDAYGESEGPAADASRAEEAWQAEHMARVLCRGDSTIPPPINTT